MKIHSRISFSSSRSWIRREGVRVKQKICYTLSVVYSVVQHKAIKCNTNHFECKISSWADKRSLWQNPHNWMLIWLAYLNLIYKIAMRFINGSASGYLFETTSDNIHRLVWYSCLICKSKAVNNRRRRQQQKIRDNKWKSDVEEG